MKKITFLIIIILITASIFINKNDMQVSNNSYDIIYKEGEVGITFILEKGMNAILINDNDNNNDLIILDYKNNETLKKQLKKFNIPKIKNLYNVTPVILNLYGVKSKFLKEDNNDLITFKYNDKDFCIYVSDNNIEKNINCEFVYMYKFSNDTKITFGNKVSLIFQNNDNRLSTKLQEVLYEKWIDIYTINPYEYATLKIMKDGFDTIIIPIIK